MVEFFALVVALVVPSRVDAHPLHTTLTEVTASDRSIRATVRMFAGDLTRAVASNDASVLAYVSGRLALLDEGGRVVTTKSCGVKRSGELLWICLDATYGGAALSVRNSLLCETFTDQVNIVQIARGSTKHSVVFTRGDGAKRVL